MFSEEVLLNNRTYLNETQVDHMTNGLGVDNVQNSHFSGQISTGFLRSYSLNQKVLEV